MIRFGSVECLLNYVTDKNISKGGSFYFTDYLHPEKPLSAKDAIFVRSDRIQSPMGAHLAAFGSESEARAFSDKNDNIYVWEEIYKSFQQKNSGSGAVHHHDHFRPDAFAPNGVMGDHLHPKGEWMFSVRYMNMQMDGLKKGSNKINAAEILSTYMVAPENMGMQMLMFGAMYAPSNKLTLALMQSYFWNEMEMTAIMQNNGMSMENRFSTHSSGLGDLKFSALYGVYSGNGKSFHLNLGISVPVGDIEKRDATPMNANAKLPYAMQPGTGTLNTTAGFTYKEMYTSTSWGTQFLATLPIGENKLDYRWGSLYQLNLWGAYRISTNFSFSGRVLGTLQNKIKGKDEDLNIMMAPTTNPANYGGEKVKLFGGMNLSFPVTSSLRNWRLAAEIGSPVYENYNGIQMDENLSFSAGLKYLIL